MICDDYLIPLGTKNIYYNVHSQYNYYIDIDDKVLLKQKCLRMLTNEIPNDKFAMKDLLKVLNMLSLKCLSVEKHLNMLFKLENLEFNEF